VAVRRLAEKQPSSFAFTAENLAWAKAQIAKYPPGRQASAVIPILWRAQQQSGGWLPQKAIEHVAELLGMANIRVLEVATFYTMFNLAPVGRFYVQLCGTTPCMLRGSEEIKNVCRRMIGEEGHVSADGMFSWIEVECLGACVNAPMVQINADYYEDLDAESFTRILNDLSAGKKPRTGPQIDRRFSAPVGSPTTLTDPAIYAAHANGGGTAGSVADAEAKKPGEAANVREAAVPKPPVADSSRT
jgi:NADH-quinone oxidoreductase subunit E